MGVDTSHFLNFDRPAPMRTRVGLHDVNCCRSDLGRD